MLYYECNLIASNGVGIMTPDEILRKLEKNGIRISRKTLYNWEKAALIPEPEFRNSRTADYPIETYSQVFAAYTFLQSGVYISLLDFNVKVPMKGIANIRKRYLEIRSAGYLENLKNWRDKDYTDVKDFINMLYSEPDEESHDYIWWIEQYAKCIEIANKNHI